MRLQGVRTACKLWFQVRDIADIKLCSKIRYALNYKKIKYTDVFLDFPEIPANHQSIGISPHVKGSQITDYTVAAIKHGNAAIQNGPQIIDYLEELCPLPSVYPGPGTKTLSQAIYNLFAATGLMSITKFVCPRICLTLTLAAIRVIFPTFSGFLTDSGGAYFNESRSRMFGYDIQKCITDEERREHEQKLVGSIKGFAPLLEAEEGPFFAGCNPCYGDFEIVAYLSWFELGKPFLIAHCFETH
jgi:glutathione S-transferase